MFLGTLDWRVLGVLRRAFLAHSGHSLLRLLDYILLGAILFARRSPWPREPIGPENLVWAGYIYSHSSLIFSCSTTWTAQGACKNQQAWFYRRRDLFRLSDRICRSDVLLNSHNSSNIMTDAAGPAVDPRRLTRRDKVLVLVMTISHPFYFIVFLNC